MDEQHRARGALPGEAASPDGEVGWIDARLLSDPDDHDLAVLADALQALGDPRGEWIALQLAGTPIELDPGLQFIRGWFSLEFDYSTHHFTRWEPFAPWIRTIRIRAAGELLERFLEDLCRRCPRLETLALHVDGPTKPGETCDAIQWALELSPRLRTLELQCDQARIRPLSHPGVRRLHATGGAAAQVLLARESSWPSITELAFEPRAREDRLDLEHVRTPRVLDLAMSEPPAGVRDVAAMVEAELGHLTQLEHLRLPAIRSESSFERIERITRALPRLRVEVVRAYRQYRLSAPPPSLVLPVAVTWPAPHTPLVRLYVDGEPVETEPLLRWLDAAQPAMTTVQRDAWLELFAPWDPRENRRWRPRREAVETAMTALPVASPLRRSTAWEILGSRYAGMYSV